MEAGVDGLERDRRGSAFVRKLVALVVKKMTPRTRPKRNNPKLPRQLLTAAYAMSTLYILICAYFAMLYGLKFSKEMEKAWLIAFIISMVQMFVIQETLKIGGRETLKTVVFPQFTAFLAGSILARFF